MTKYLVQGIVVTSHGAGKVTYYEKFLKQKL